jgi:hypothetical protein
MPSVTAREAGIGEVSQRLRAMVALALDGRLGHEPDQRLAGCRIARATEVEDAFGPWWS